MSVYEYLPRELARLDVQRKAAGLDRGRVRERVRLAQEHEEQSRSEPTGPTTLGRLAIAVWHCLEWERIAHVMAEQQMPVYEPGQDGRVARWEEIRLQRLSSHAAEAGQTGGEDAAVARERVYRIVAQQNGGTHSGALAVTAHLMASSISDAAWRASVIWGRRDGLYERGGYQITRIDQILPEAGELF
ncbi:hypothetical protein [Streptomyces syringium]|uniref:hypothetical protein n=1 Tax=Streptomyces syringium TaxID=76729 RepID=UPI0033B35DC5